MIPVLLYCLQVKLLLIRTERRAHDCAATYLYLCLGPCSFRPLMPASVNATLACTESRSSKLQFYFGNNTVAFVKLFLTGVRTLQMPQGELLVNDSSRPLGSENLLVVICQFPEPFDPAMSLTIVAARRPPTGAATTIFLVGAMLTGAPSNCRPNTAMTKWLCPRLSSRTTSDFALASGWP